MLLFGSEKTFHGENHGTCSNLALTETEYEQMSHTPLQVSIMQNSEHAWKWIVPLDLNILQGGDEQIQQFGATNGKEASYSGVAMEKSLRLSMPLSQFLHLKMGPLLSDGLMII